MEGQTYPKSLGKKAFLTQKSYRDSEQKEHKKVYIQFNQLLLTFLATKVHLAITFFLDMFLYLSVLLCIELFQEVLDKSLFS